MTADNAYLYLSKEAGGDRVALTGDHMVLGRQSGCDIRINDLRVSRRHAEFYRDPFHRWWVRDLGSRNGTKINDAPIQEHALQGGDVIGIESLALTFTEGTMSGIWKKPGAGTSVTLMGDAESRIQYSDELETPRIDAKHLSQLTSLGSELLRHRDETDRLKRLCELLVHEEFRGRYAMALRVQRSSTPDEDPSPEALCDTVFGKSAAGFTPYVSSTTLKSVQQRGTAVVASNVMDGTGVVSMSLSGDAMPLMSVVACPLGQPNDDFIDLIYVALPVECGNGEWLAMVQLACEEFRQAQEAWAARQAAQEHAVIERELERGREIQRRLLPRNTNLPGWEVGLGFEPCRWVGGDYLDVVPTGDGRTLLVVADVCGKGLQAALITSSLHAMVHASAPALAAGSVTLAGLVQNLNDYLCQALPDDSFVSMVAVLIDDATGALQCVNAGHPPAMVLSPDASKQPRELQIGVNPPLAMEPGPMAMVEDTIERGGVLAMFTDGLTEIGEAESMLGQGGVAKWIREFTTSHPTATMQLAADNLLQRLRNVQSSSLQLDDRTVLLVRRS